MRASLLARAQAALWFERRYTSSAHGERHAPHAGPSPLPWPLATAGIPSNPRCISEDTRLIRIDSEALVKQAGEVNPVKIPVRMSDS